MRLFRCLLLLFAGMALAVIFLGRGSDQPAPEMARTDPVPETEEVAARADSTPATMPLTAAATPDPQAEEMSPKPATFLPEPESSLVRGTPVHFGQPADRNRDYARRDAPADMRPEGLDDQAHPAGVLYVTASRVNLRSGPGTGNAVVTTLTDGTEAVPIGEPQNGWQKIRVAATGDEGWMADRFLGTARP